MSTYYYIVNKTKHEYITCPRTCGLKFYVYFAQQDSCVRYMLTYLLCDEWRDNVISLVSEYDPIFDDEDYEPKYKDISEETLKKYLDALVLDHWDIPHFHHDKG